MKRLVLSAEDFQNLVSGGVVTQDGVQIILSDIGYVRMLRILFALSEIDPEFFAEE